MSRTGPSKRSFPQSLEGKTLAFVGDSITADLRFNYVTLVMDRLASELDVSLVDVVNSGIDSSSVFDALDRAPDIVLEHAPDVVVVFLGMNDSKIFRHNDCPLVPVKAFESTYRALLARLDTPKKTTKLLLTPPDPLFQKVKTGSLLKDYWYWTPESFGSYVAAVKKIAREESCGLADVQQSFAASEHRERLFTEDGVHPNVLGHQIIATSVIDGLRVLMS